MKLASALSFVVVIAWLSTPIVAAGPKSIFDDDWVPPSQGAPAKPAPVKPVTPAPSDPPKVEPSKADLPKSDPPPVAPQVATPVPAARAAVRLAIPPLADQAAVRKVMKEVFADQLADTSIAGRRKLAEALIGQAEKSNDVPVEQFVLLAASLNAATEAANLPLAFQAADRMARAFDVKASAVKTESLLKLEPRRGGTELNIRNARAGLELVDQLLAAEDLATAERACAALSQIPGAPSGEVQKRERALIAARGAAERIARQSEILKASPDDPGANLEVGRYLCFSKSDWKAGLPLLAKGSDAPLKSAAERELAGGVDAAAARLALGDAWWDAAPEAPGPTRDAVLSHACEWYAKAAPELKGLNKLKVDKRMAANPRPAGGTATTGAGVASAGTTGAGTAGAGTSSATGPATATGYYSSMLGIYYRWDDVKKPHPFINLSVPASNLWSEPIKAQMRGKVTFDEMAYRGKAKLLVPADGVYKVLAKDCRLLIDGKLVDTGEMEMTKGMHEVLIESGTHGGPYLTNAAVQITFGKTLRPLTFYNTEADVKAFLAASINGSAPREVSGWKLEDHRVDALNDASAPVAVTPPAVAPPAVTPPAARPTGAMVAAPAGKGAQVEVEGAEWDVLRDGAALTGDARFSTAGTIPAVLKGRSFSRLKGTPRLTFKVITDGTVIMACTDRFERSGNGGGNWRSEITQRAELEKQRWVEIGSIPVPGQNLNWVAYTRECKAGETFTYRTEKYMNPFLIR